MDFGFSPALDAHTTDLAGMFARRANTTLISKGVTSLRAFIQHLNNTSSITKPIGDLLLGMHANDEGQLLMSMFPGQKDAWTKFETLEETLKDSAKSIAIPDSLIGFTSGSTITHNVHIKGCNVGQAQPFLLKFKEALGGNVNVTAPFFFHGATPGRAEGMFEYMGYEFVHRRKELFPFKAATAVQDRKAALAEFDTEQFHLIDGSVVPTNDWDKLVPPNPNKDTRVQVDSQLGTSIGKRTTIRTPRQYRVTPITFGPWTVPFPNAGSVPTTQVSQEQALENHLPTDSRFQTSHPYPQWQREGFADLSAFMAAYKWDCRPRGASLVCNGKRYLFIIALAITDPATTPVGKIFADGTLLFNFYPNAGSGLTAITNTLQVTDPKFFSTT